MNKIQPEPAILVDIPVLVDHHHRMFKAIFSFRNIEMNPRRLEIMDKEYEEKLKKEMADGSCKAWVIRTDGDIQASGAMTLVSMVPTPADPYCAVAYIHSVFTEDGHRRRGFSTCIVNEIVNYCRSCGIKRLILNSSEAGKNIYRKIGFELADNSMRMHL